MHNSEVTESKAGFVEQTVRTVIEKAFRHLYAVGCEQPCLLAISLAEAAGSWTNKQRHEPLRFVPLLVPYCGHAAA